MTPSVPRPHLPTVVGRWRSDAAVLLLTALVVALAVGVTAAVDPVTEHAADRAIAATVRDAGRQADVVATLPEWYDDPRGKELDPSTATQVRQDADLARQVLPPDLAAVVRPGVVSVTTPPLQLLDAGPGRMLQLAFVETDGRPPAVTYVDGAAPGAVRPADAGSVEVAVDRSVAEALAIGVGDRLPAEDEQGRTAELRVSGVFTADAPADDAWQVSDRLLHPVQGVADGLAYTTGAALVSAGALPDLRLSLPADDLDRRLVLTPEPSRARWRATRSLERSIVSLQSSSGVSATDLSWDSRFGAVLQRGREEVAAARGQAQVLVVGLLGATMLVLVLAAQLLVRRRRDELATLRQRGASLGGVALELLVEGLAVTVLGGVVGWGVVRLAAGSAGWTSAVPVLLVAALAVPLLGAVSADSHGGGRRVPANRGARRTAERARRLRRLAAEAAVVAAAVLTTSALLQRGVTGVGVAEDAAWGDATAASAPTWWALAGALLLVHLLPHPVRWAMRGTRRSPGGVGFLVAARVAETGVRALPVLVLVVAVAGTTVAGSLVATAREGQAAGALTAVGGDGRIDAEPQADLSDVAAEAEDEPGVVAAVAGRVEDGVRISSGGAVEVVRLVVVDAADYADLLAAGDLPDASRLALLGAAGGDSGGDPGGDPVPALLRSGGSPLADRPTVRWEDVPVVLDVVGTAPDVDASTDPVLVVDASAFADAGAVALPNTLWLSGPGTDQVIDAVASRVTGVDAVVRRSEVVEARRAAPLTSALLALAVASSALLVLLGVLGIVLSVAAEAPERSRSLGRLRALGMADRDLRRVLLGELVAPVAGIALVGWSIGVACSYAVLGALSLDLLTGEAVAPRTVVPWWTVLAVPVVVAAALGHAVLEARRVRRRDLSRLVRA
ncbi:hypothetical protein L2K70_16810 [Nocardioides KLBMP 9356]|uniref:ABC3 transporter permease C-terminal domain-containing protein n=1 Tax=Nocardioides potassii TaxID=2911371 RepID=A0ABS9HFQ7_9ACTN|nr:FtsX-like permease family protein [Nocardioides potassii]MCF6379274.1 hypothetical protein [Nocardioides potassii]